MVRRVHSDSDLSSIASRPSLASHELHSHTSLGGGDRNAARDDKDWWAGWAASGEEGGLTQLPGLSEDVACEVQHDALQADNLDSEDENIPHAFADSDRHATGNCRPCKYIDTPMGCCFGNDCRFCHLSHKKSRVRPSKSTRKKCKKLVASLDTASSETVEAITGMAAQKPYLMNILRAKGHVPPKISDKENAFETPQIKSNSFKKQSSINSEVSTCLTSPSPVSTFGWSLPSLYFSPMLPSQQKSLMSL